MYLPRHIASRSLHPEMRGMTILGPDGNVRHEWFVYFKTIHPANIKSWDELDLFEIHREVELQEQHEGAFTARYVLTALLNFHRKMLYWSNPEAVELDSDGKETLLLPFVAEDYLHESIIRAMKQDGRGGIATERDTDGSNPLLWPDSHIECSGKPARDPQTGEALSERLRFLDMGENALAYEVAYLDKLDDIMRDNGLEGANLAVFNSPLTRKLPPPDSVGPIIVRMPVGPQLPPARERGPDAREMADKSVTRPTTRIHMREQYGDWYPHGEVQMA